MDGVIYDYINGKFSIIYNNDITFNVVGDEQILTYLNVVFENVKSFTIDATNLTKDRNIYPEMRVSRDNRNWTEWIPLNTTPINQPPFNPRSKHTIEIRLTRIGSNTKGVIVLNKFELKGNIERKINDSETTVLLQPDVPALFKPSSIYKIFKIDNIEVLSNKPDNLTVKYRYSQDYGRSVTEWEPLTLENISTARINPTRFFQIEYMVTSNTVGAKVFDINIIGDFQNVTNDYKKTNLYGIRENCNCIMLNMIEGNQDNNMNTGVLSDSQGTCVAPAVTTPLTDEQKSKLFDPYEMDATMQMYATLAADITAQYGHDVIYVVTDPDQNGTDYSLHEHQLYNYICHDMMKVVVDNNAFPNDQLSMNPFGLDFMDSFEIHVMKTDFKTKFGVEKRPSKEDYVWFCKLNKLYQVIHAQDFRTVNNYSYYYKVMLKKATKKANIQGVNDVMNNIVHQLTKNETIDELIGRENDNDKASVANKDQLLSSTIEPIRSEIKCDIINEDIVNSSVIVANTAYDLSSIKPNTAAVIYKDITNHLKVSDNFAYTAWFRFNDYYEGDTYNLFHYYDSVNHMGMRLNITDGSLKYIFNDTTYSMDINAVINSNVWYSIVININNRQRSIDAFIYKRNTTREDDAKLINSSNLKLVWSSTLPISIANAFIENDTHAQILASEMEITNIRLFNTVIPNKKHNITLNTQIVGNDSKHLILADNANKQLILPYFPTNRGDHDIPDNIS